MCGSKYGAIDTKEVPSALLDVEGKEEIEWEEESFTPPLSSLELSPPHNPAHLLAI